MATYINQSRVQSHAEPETHRDIIEVHKIIYFDISNKIISTYACVIEIVNACRYFRQIFLNACIKNSTGLLDHLVPGPLNL